jgi:N-acetylmuramoyl-L-alanine amidase
LKFPLFLWYTFLVISKKGRYKMKKGNNKTRLLSAAITLSLLLSLTSVPSNANTRELSALADTNSAMDVDGRVYPYLKGISNKNVWAHNRFSIVIGGRTLSVKGIELNGVAYLPFRAATGAISGSSYSYNSQTRTSVMRAPDLEITVSDGGYVTYANGRALFNTTPCVIMSDGRLYIPVSVFAKAVGMTVGTDGGNIRLSGSFKPLLHADKFYNKDEVFWLGRIIHAESRGEPLFGKIAVGNVVLNRVKASAYPNTIYGVIFDRKYGVQFSPVLDGTIYNTPDFNSILAAKICLDGYMISPEFLFFLEPSHSTSSWIPKNREYLFTIGKHDFYK